jgi:hypothetical protein
MALDDSVQIVVTMQAYCAAMRALQDEITKELFSNPDFARNSEYFWDKVKQLSELRHVYEAAPFVSREGREPAEESANAADEIPA